VDEVVRLGVADRDRIAVGGHSYGAFMTANLLAHTDLFRTGVARSGAYNRTLTPFGFQAEQRTYWEAPETYTLMSPFTHVAKIKEPILLIHGEVDDNSGTFPIQSERFYAALKGQGANVRYVVLPLEAHGYRARESVMHTLWETVRWLDTHVKNANRGRRPRRRLTPQLRKWRRPRARAEPVPRAPGGAMLKLPSLVAAAAALTAGGGAPIAIAGAAPAVSVAEQAAQARMTEADRRLAVDLAAAYEAGDGDPTRIARGLDEVVARYEPLARAEAERRLTVGRVQAARAPARERAAVLRRAENFAGFARNWPANARAKELNRRLDAELTAAYEAAGRDSARAGPALDRIVARHEVLWTALIEGELARARAEAARMPASEGAAALQQAEWRARMERSWPRERREQIERNGDLISPAPPPPPPPRSGPR
jgi:dienelactone hydrolase